MATISEYRRFADKCMRWATEAEDAEMRQLFLDLARDWTFAASHLEAVLTPEPEAQSPGS
jgi:hypothetical protein